MRHVVMATPAALMGTSTLKKHFGGSAAAEVLHPLEVNCTPLPPDLTVFLNTFGLLKEEKEARGEKQRG